MDNAPGPPEDEWLTVAQVVALADVFPDRLNACREQLARLKCSIPNEMCFTGFDAHKQLLAVPEVNYVILATPPHFRPMHLKAAIEAGKNVFMEKPVAVDGPGIKMVLEDGITDVSIAVEAAPSGVRVSCFQPGPVMTELERVWGDRTPPGGGPCQPRRRR